MADLDDTTTLPARRRDIEAWIEGLVDLLDAFDEDADMEEPGDVEPSLGWPQGHSGFGGPGGTADLEDDHADCEASLGWSSDIRQTNLANGNRGNDVDLEDEHDGCEHDIDGEASLGWANDGSQLDLAAGNRGSDDREEECEDEGAELLTNDVPRAYKTVRDRATAQAATIETVRSARARRRAVQPPAAAGAWELLP